MKRVKMLAVLNAIFFVVAFAISMLSQVGFFKYNMSEVSAKYDTVFTPAGITFSVWGIIYTALFIFCIYHLIKAFRENESHEANQSLIKVGWLFIINNIAISAWVVFWLNEQLIASVILMLIQLLSLIFIHVRLNILDIGKSIQGKLCTQFPLSIYFAWICIASIANISATLVGYNWNGGLISPSYWTIIMIGIATLLSIFVILVKQNVFFGLVVIWALYGIVLKRTDVDPATYGNVINAARTGIAVVFLAELIQSIKLLRLTKPSSEISARHG